MKGQAQAVTAVLITSVVIGSVATAYVWGIPLLEKQSGQENVQKAENSVVSLYKTVVDVSESGEGTTAQFNFGSKFSGLESTRVSINEKKDYIDVRIRAQNPPYPIDVWTLIEGKSFQNLTTGSGDYAIQGSDLPGTVAVRPVGSPESTLITYRIEFRNMLVRDSSGRSLSRIDLEAQGKKNAVEPSKIFLTNDGTSLTSNYRTSTGQLLPRRITTVQVGFR